MKLKLSQISHFLRTHVSDLFTEAIATWHFIILYTIIIFFWIVLHKKNILTFDTDLTYCSFFLCWLSGIQASIIMMSDGRKESKHYDDTKKDLEVSEKTLEIDLKNKELIKRMAEKVTAMVNKINKLEEIIEIMEKEEEDKANGTSNKGNGRIKIKTKFRREN